MIEQMKMLNAIKRAKTRRLSYLLRAGILAESANILVKKTDMAGIALDCARRKQSARRLAASIGGTIR